MEDWLSDIFAHFHCVMVYPRCLRAQRRDLVTEYRMSLTTGRRLRLCSSHSAVSSGSSSLGARLWLIFSSEVPFACKILRSGHLQYVLLVVQPQHLWFSPLFDSNWAHLSTVWMRLWCSCLISWWGGSVGRRLVQALPPARCHPRRRGGWWLLYFRAGICDDSAEGDIFFYQGCWTAVIE